ncbi:MAG: hypothetical protein ABJR05_05575 [Balneola sp.]
MNLGLATTYVVGGLMMLSIIGYNISTYNSSVETTSSVITQTKLDNLVSILQTDLSRIGYNVDTGTTDAFTVAEDSSISFRGDIYDDSSDDFDLVEWEFDRDPDTTTTNPNDFILKRTWNSTPSIPGNEVEYTYSVSYFRLNYYDIDGASTTNRDDIIQVEVELMVESNEPYYTSKNGDESYYRVVWKRKIVANNLIY